MKTKLIQTIDAILPQTQCQECGYPACKPYAEAIVNDDEDIGLCAPGSLEVLDKIAALTDQDPLPKHDAVLARTRPAQIAVIDEDRCIGCTKCIPPCPVDAIVGAGKMAHSILTDACTGCARCIAPCPVDCISLEAIPEPSAAQAQRNADTARTAYTRRLARQARGPDLRTQANPNADIKSTSPAKAGRDESQALIAAALAAAQAKTKGQDSNE